jgi:hypothetical protein
MNEYIKLLISFFGGSIVTQLINWYKNKIQIMKCYYIDDDIISKIPITIENGERHNNIFSKQFILKNTTNKDIDSFIVIFEFDCSSKIIRHTNTTKSGIDKLKPKYQKPNECSIMIRKFNRKDEVKFIFEIANITKDEINITESNCLGFKISTLDKRKVKSRTKLTQVSKEQINAT